MKKLLKLPIFFVLLVAGLSLAGCAGSTQAVISTGPARPYYDAYYGPVYRPYYRPYYRPARVVRPRVVVRPRPVVVSPAPRYHRGYHGGRGRH